MTSQNKPSKNIQFQLIIFRCLYYSHTWRNILGLLVG